MLILQNFACTEIFMLFLGDFLLSPLKFFPSNFLLTFTIAYDIINIEKYANLEVESMEKAIGEIGTAALAYLGDSVIEICVRETLVKMGVSSAKNLNSAALRFVRAEAQAEAVMKILPILSDEENAAYRRGRNIGHTNVPKSATVGQYRMATGLEALFGYLHLKGEAGRIKELFALAFADQINEFTNKEN